jgi:hypothetical protein
MAGTATFEREARPMARQVTGWVGWVWFGAFTLLTVGLFNIMGGLVAVLSPKDVLAWSGHSVVLVDVSAWGWVHIVLGALLVLVACFLFAARPWARIVASILVVLNLLTQFLSLPITPWWSIAVIVLDVFVLWALIVHGAEVEEAVR